MSESQNQSVRADVWLWAARFFKTRSLCRQALDGGKVALNDAPCKPSKGIRVGDRLRITRANERYDIEVIALAAKRGPASVAQTLYAESEASRSAREAAREQARWSRPLAPAARPDKQARRQLRQFKQIAED